MPCYAITVDQMIGQGDVVAIFGSAWGRLVMEEHSPKSWSRPCAWRARVSDGRVALWQVYVDTKVVFDLLQEPS